MPVSWPDSRLFKEDKSSLTELPFFDVYHVPKQHEPLTDGWCLLTDLYLAPPADEFLDGVSEMIGRQAVKTIISETT